MEEGEGETRRNKMKKENKLRGSRGDKAGDKGELRIDRKSTRLDAVGWCDLIYHCCIIMRKIIFKKTKQTKKLGQLELSLPTSATAPQNAF